MRSDYFRPNQEPSPILVATILAAMILALILLPSLAFANDDIEKDPLPRYLISPEDIAAKVAVELENMGYGELIEAKLHTDDPNIMFGADEPMTVNLSGLSASRKSKKWTANVLFKHGEKILTALPMKGRYDEMIELPVLSTPLSAGTIIEEKHLGKQAFPAHYQRSGVVTDPTELLGKSARRNISVERPIRAHEVSTPIIVKKNDLVNLVYSNQSLSISTTGQVQADAAIGDVVAVKNINSDKIVRAVMREDKSAQVTPLNQTTTAMTEADREYN